MLDLNKLYKGRLLSWAQKRQWSAFQAFPLGMVIAMSFCPATAALFFGLLLPLAIQHQQMISFPVIYALGAGLPLVVISFMLYKGLLLFKNAPWQKHLPKIVGTFLILMGIYFTIDRIYL